MTSFSQQNSNKTKDSISVAILSGATVQSVFNSTIKETVRHINQPLGVLLSTGGVKWKRYVLRRLLKVAIEVADPTESVILNPNPGNCAEI